MCEKTEQICEGQGWEVITCDDGRLIVATPGDIVCHQDPNHASGDETDAKRFKLIAAAPDLLNAAALAMEGIEVLDLMVASIEKHGNYSVESTLGFLNQALCAKLRLSEAISRAEGRS